MTVKRVEEPRDDDLSRVGPQVLARGMIDSSAECAGTVDRARARSIRRIARPIAIEPGDARARHARARSGDDEEKLAANDHLAICLKDDSVYEAVAARASI